MGSMRLGIEIIYLDYFCDLGKLVKKWTRALVALKIEGKQLYRDF